MISLLTLYSICAGDGGTFALYQGLYPPNELNGDADRTLTGETLNNDASAKRVDDNASFSMRLKSKSQVILLVWVSNDIS